MYGTQAQEWPHTHRARAAVEAAEEVAATAQVDQPVVGLAHDITDERDAENGTCKQFCQGVSGLHGDQLAVFLSQFASDDDALLADFQRSLGSAEPYEAAAGAVRALMRSVRLYLQGRECGLSCVIRMMNVV